MIKTHCLFCVLKVMAFSGLALVVLQGCGLEQQSAAGSNSHELLKGSVAICPESEAVVLRGLESMVKFPDPDMYKVQWLNARTFVYVGWDGTSCTWLRFTKDQDTSVTEGDNSWEARAKEELSK